MSADRRAFFLCGGAGLRGLPRQPKASDDDDACVGWPAEVSPFRQTRNGLDGGPPATLGRSPVQGWLGRSLNEYSYSVLL